jgi:hypothetical protein
MKIVRLLYEFEQKAGCMHTQRRAESLWHMLEPLLTDSERSELSLAWFHYTSGDNNWEIYDVCNKLIEKYERGPNRTIS